MDNKLRNEAFREDTPEQLSLFKEEPKLENGIYQALKQRPKLPLAQASNFLPLTAKLYEPLWRKRSLSLLTRGHWNVARELQAMLEWTQPQNQQVFLDAGCSAGLYARTLLAAEPNLRVHALDFSLPFLEKAQSYALRDGVSPCFVHADVNNLPYQDHVFDAIVCGGSANEFMVLEQALHEFARVLKPEGRLWLMYLQEANTNLGRMIQAAIRPSGIRFIQPDTLEQKAKQAGLLMLKTDVHSPVVMALFEKT